MSLPYRDLVAFECLILPGSQLAAQKLAGCGAGNGLHEYVLPGALETGEAALQAHIVELLGRELGGRRFNESHHLGAEPLVRHAYDGAARDELAACEGVLNFLGKDVFAAADDHVRSEEHTSELQSLRH